MSGYGGGGRDGGGARWNAGTQSWERYGGPPGPVGDAGPAVGGAEALVVRAPEYAVTPPVPPYAPEYGPGGVPAYVPEEGGWRSAGPADAPAGPAGRPSVRTGLVAGAVVAVLVVGSVGGRLIWGGDAGDPVADGPEVTGTATVPDPSSEPVSPSTDPFPTETTETTGTPEGTDGTATPGASGAATPPPGYGAVEDPKGFTLAVPEGWDRTESGQSVFYTAPDGTRLIQVYAVTGGGQTPYEALRATSEDSRTSKPGYREIQLERISGDPDAPADAAELVYVYTRDDGSRRKVVDRAFTAGDGTQYAVLAAGPEDEWPNQREVLRVALEFFAPGTS
ncbi:hypothetical protein [Streptomyces sp. NPDC094049]|uniref:hypothetical protein n=1 Tax=Streptomyces sp. NPDC094049 TaxID=3154987 RepID=UPI0033268C9A